tara:strand:+ start:1617 stop:1868 length:252 start_codon:yes stop_codon:yes gene_type:complete
MKRFLIVTTILIFACSSDDSSDTNDDNSNNYKLVETYEYSYVNNDPNSNNFGTFDNGNALRLIFSDGMQEQIFSRTNISNPCN